MALAENLNRAIQSGDEELVRKLVKEGANMDHLLGMRGTALCAALSARQSTIASYLIDAGCGVNVEDYDREPPLYLAISKECFDVARKLVRHPKCQLNKADPLTNTPPLCLAVSCGFESVVGWFIEAGADLNVRRGSDNYTPLHCAIRTQNYKILDMLIQADCDLFAHDNDGHLAIHIAARENDVTVLRSILCKYTKLGLNFEDKKIRSIDFHSEQEKDNVYTMVNFKSKVRNLAPLVVSLLNGHINFATLLLKCGADPNILPESESNCVTPLCLACYHFCCGNCDLHFVEWLLKAGARVNNPSVGHRLTRDETGHRDRSEETPIMIAARENNVELIRLLRKFKCDVVNKNVTRGLAAAHTPFTYAIFNEAFDAAKFFLENCPEINYKSNMSQILKAMMIANCEEISDIIDSLLAKGCSLTMKKFCPLTEAITHHNTCLVKALIRAGMTVNKPSMEDQIPPLQVCAEVGSTEIARILLDSGADINVKNDNGVTPLRTAMDYSDEAHIELCRFLLNSQAHIPSDLVELAEEFEENHDLCKNEDISDSDSEADDTDSSDSRSIPDALSAEPELLVLMRNLLSSPKSLFQLCIQSIRNHFVENSISYSILPKLSIPKKIQDIIAYKA